MSESQSHSCRNSCGISPCEINVAVTAISNYFFTHLSKKDFVFLNVCISELSKSMFSMELLRGICKVEKIEKKVEEVLDEVLDEDDEK